MLSSQFCYFRRIVFDQSSPVLPISESRGGSRSRTEDDGRKSLCLMLDLLYPSISCSLKFHNSLYPVNTLDWRGLARPMQFLRLFTNSGSSPLFQPLPSPLQPPSPNCLQIRYMSHVTLPTLCHCTAQYSSITVKCA